MADQPAVKISIDINDLLTGLNKLQDNFNKQLKDLENVAEVTKKLQEQYNLTGNSATKAADDVKKLTDVLNQATSQANNVVNATSKLNTALSSNAGAQAFADTLTKAFNQVELKADEVRDRLSASDFGRRHPGSAPPGERGSGGNGFPDFFNQFDASKIAASRAELDKFQSILDKTQKSASFLFNTTDKKGDFLFNERQIQEVFKAVRLKEQLNKSLFVGNKTDPGLELVNPDDFSKLLQLYSQVRKLFDAYDQLGTAVNKVTDAQVKAREAANAAAQKQDELLQKSIDKANKELDAQRKAAEERFRLEQQTNRRIGEQREAEFQKQARLARIEIENALKGENRLRAEQEQAVRDKVASQLTTGIRAQSIAPANADVGRVLQLNTAIQNLGNTVRQTNIPLDQLHVLFQTIKLNPANFALRELNNLPPDLKKVAEAMVEVDKAQQLVERSGKAASDSLIISWRGIARIFEAQVIHRSLSAIYNDLLGNVSVAAELQVKISEIRTIAQSSQIPFAHIQASIRALADEFGNDQIDIAKAAYEALSNQVVQGAETFQFLRQALILGQTTVTDAKTSVNLLSSAINAFKLQASDAERINSVFFKTIELGRLRAEEISDTFGRTGVLAQKLGISLEEVSAALATTTIQGFRVDEAQTLLSNLLLKLLKPTESFSALLKEMGFRSGEAAVQALGLGGILQILSEQGEKGADVLALQVNELRALKGAFALTGDSLSLYQRNLEGISNRDAVKQTSEAAKIIKESAGKEFLLFQQQIKNTFISAGNIIVEEFIKMKRVVDDIARAFEPFTNFVGRFTSLVPLIKAGTAAFIAYTTITRAAAFINTVFANSQLRVNTNLTGLPLAAASAESSILRLSRAMTVLNTTTLAVTALLTLITLDAANTQESIRALEFGGADLAVKLDKQTQEVAGKFEKAQADVTRADKAKNAEIFKNAITTNAKLLAEADKQSKDLVGASKASTDALKLGFDQYVKGLNEAVKKTKQTIDENKTQIENSAKFLAGLATAQPEKLFQQSLKFEEDPVQKIKLIEGRIKNLKEEITGLFAKGDDESVKAAQEKVKEINKLIGEQLDIQVSRRREESEILAKQGLLIGNINSQGKTVVSVADLVNAARRKEADILKFATELSDKNVKTKERENATLTDSVKKEEARIAAIAQAAKQLEAFKVLNEKGEVVKQFATPTGEIDTKKVESEAKRLSDSLGALLTDKGNETANINKLVNQKVAIEEAAALAQRNEARIRFQQQELINTKKHNDDLIEEVGRGITEQKKLFLQYLDDLAKASDQVRRISEVGNRQGLAKELLGIDILPAIPGLFESERRFRSIPEATRIADLDRNIKSTVSQIKELEAAGKEVDPAVYDELAKKFRILSAELRAYISIRNEGTLTDEKGNPLSIDKTETTVDGRTVAIGKLVQEAVDKADQLASKIELIRSLEKQREGLQAAQKPLEDTLSKQVEQIALKGEDLSKAFGNAADKMAAFSGIAGTLATGGGLSALGLAIGADNGLKGQVDKLTTGVTGVTTSLNTLSNVDIGVAENQKKVEALTSEFENLKKTIDEVNQKKIEIEVKFPPGFVPQIRTNGAELEGKAFGGFLNTNNVGTDATIFRGTKGEFVTNPISSAKFAPQLQDINQGKFPSPTVGGSITNNNNTNVGDIIIQVTREMSEQELAQLLKRGIRRGTIRL